MMNLIMRKMMMITMVQLFVDENDGDDDDEVVNPQKLLGQVV